MPIYEYRCTGRKCGQTYEFMHGLKDKPPRATCEKCGARLERMVSASSFVLKGTGWYKTDYGSKKPSADKVSKSDSASASSSKNGKDKDKDKSSKKD
jgi:putative FmdB family regulatory protein